MTTMAPDALRREWDTIDAPLVFSSPARSEDPTFDPVDAILDDVRNAVGAGRLTAEVLLARLHALQQLQCKHDDAWLNELNIPRHLRDAIWCRLAERATPWIDLLEGLAPSFGQRKRRFGLSRIVPSWLASLLRL